MANLTRYFQNAPPPPSPTSDKTQYYWREGLTNTDLRKECFDAWYREGGNQKTKVYNHGQFWKSFWFSATKGAKGKTEYSHNNQINEESTFLDFIVRFFLHLHQIHIQFQELKMCLIPIEIRVNYQRSL